MGRPQERTATTEHCEEGWETFVDGRAVQLLEASSITGPPDVDVHGCHNAPSKWMARIHNRMPVILQDDQIGAWLDPTISDPQQLGELLKAPPEDFLDCYAISRQIDSVKFDEPEHAKEIALDYQTLLQSES